DRRTWPRRRVTLSAPPRWPSRSADASRHAGARRVSPPPRTGGAVSAPRAGVARPRRRLGGAGRLSGLPELHAVVARRGCSALDGARQLPGAVRREPVLL